MKNNVRRFGIFFLPIFWFSMLEAQIASMDSITLKQYQPLEMMDSTNLVSKSSVLPEYQNFTFTKKRNLLYYLQYRPYRMEPKSLQWQIQLDTRQSFVTDLPINIYGVNLGAKINQRFRLGVGIYFFIQTFKNEELGLHTGTGAAFTDRSGRPFSVSSLNTRHIHYIPAVQKLSVYFATLNFAYSIYNSRLIEVSLPVELGYGYFKEELTDPSGNNFESLPRVPKSTEGYFMPMQLGTKVSLKVHTWAHLFSSVGYRHTLFQYYVRENRLTNFNDQFDGFYYQFGIALQTRVIFESIFPTKRKLLIRNYYN